MGNEDDYPVIPPEGISMGDAMLKTYEHSARTERKIRESADRLERISDRLDRLYSLRGFATVTGIVVVGSLLAGLITFGLVWLVNLAAEHADISQQLALGVVGTFLAAALAAVARWLIRGLQALLSDPSQDASDL